MGAMRGGQHMTWGENGADRDVGAERSREGVVTAARASRDASPARSASCRHHASRSGYLLGVRLEQEYFRRHAP